MTTKLTLIVCFVLIPIRAAAQDSVTGVLAGTGPGGGLMRHLSVDDGTELASANPFGPSFAGGVRVASGDITGDGTPDFITGAGFGGGQVVVLDGQDLSVAWAFAPFGASFTGGVYVAAGDINGDGRADVIAGGGLGRGQVRVYSGTDHSLIVTRTPFGSSYLGGVTAAAGDINGDTRDDLVTGMAIGGTMRVVSGLDGSTIMSKSPYGAAFIAGINVAAGDIDGDGRTDVVTGPGLLLRQVNVFNGHDGTVLATFTPYPTGGVGGVTVAAGKVDVDTRADIITGPGPLTQPLIKIFSGLDQSLIRSFLGFAPTFMGGVYVASVLGETGAPEFTSADHTTFEVGVLGTFEVTTSHGSPALTVTGTLPSGVTFTDNGDGTGTLEGTPADGTGGVYPLTFAADDGVNPPVNQAFTLTVNESPEITSADNDTFAAGVADSFTVTTTGYPTPSLTMSGTPPTGVTFTDNGNGTGTLSGTATQSGTFPLQFTAANGVSPDALQNFTLTVSCSAITVDPSTIPDGLYQVPYGPVPFTQSGGSGTITWSATGLPAGLSINSSSGVLSGTPSDTVLNAAVTVTATDGAGCQGSRNLTLTIRPTTDNETYNGGVGHTQFAVGVTVATPNVFVNDNVKNGDNGPGSLSVAFNAPANGSVMEGSTDGTFVYTPNLGFAGPSDSFTYTLTDGNGVTNTGTVTINLSQLVWYVNSAGPNGDGRSHAPFNTLAAAAAPSGSNQYIYVHTGGATTTGDLAMDANQTLHGQGVVFSLNSLTIPAAGRPTLTGTVTLANNTAVIGANFAPVGLQALAATGVTQPVSIDQVSVNGGTNALSLTNVDGSVTVTAAAFTNSSGAELLINGGTGAVNMGADISSNAGRSVDIQNRSTGSASTIALIGAINDTGSGIFLDNNDVTTITFSGGLTLNGTSATFTATNGCTVNVTGTNTIGAATPAAGAALTVTNTIIGASGVTFRSIASNGGPKGIVLNATGGGAFTVTGTGTAGSGGTIQNASLRGAEFISANNISLSYMNFTGNGTSVASPNPACADGLNASISATNTAANCESNIHLQSVGGVTFDTLSVLNSKQNGINGHDVTNLSMTTLTVTGNGDAIGEDGIQLANLHGVNSLSSSTVRDNAARSVEVQNNAAGSTTLNIIGGAFGNTNNPTAVSVPSVATAADTILVATNGSNAASLTTVVTSAVFQNIFGRAFNSNTEGNTSQNVTFGQPGVGNGNTVTNASFGTDINGTTTGTVTYAIVNNAFTNTGGAVTGGSRTPINARKGFGATGSWSGVIDANSIGTLGVANSGCESVACGGISADNAATAGNHDIVVTNNTVYRVNGHGIFVANNPGVATTGTVRARIEGNVLQDPQDGTTGATGNQGSGVLVSTTGAGAALNIKAGGSAAAEKNDVTGNWGTASGGTIRGVRFTTSAGTSMCIAGYAGPFASANVAAWITSQNTGNAGSAAGSGFTGPGCPTP